MIRDIEFNTCGRERYREEEMLSCMKRRLRSSCISDQDLRLVLDTYLAVKREILLSGAILYEKGIGAQFVDARRVSTAMGGLGFTPRVRSDIDPTLKSQVTDLILKNPDYSKRIGYDPKRPIKEPKARRIERAKSEVLSERVEELEKENQELLDKLGKENGGGDNAEI